MANFYETIREAIKDFEEHGFDSQERLDRWMGEIERTAQQAMIPESQIKETLDKSLEGIFTRQVVKGRLLSRHEISQAKLNLMRPRLRAELDRRIMASAQLIKLNREAMIQKTLQRFSGWASSIPIGGSGAVEKREVTVDVVKALKQLPFIERRVMIDQAAKFNASLDDIVAKANDAIAIVWHSNWRQRGYDYRKDHKERDGKIYVLKDNWALRDGLMKLAGHEYYDDITHVGEEVFCQCYGEYIYALRDLPEEMLTVKGKEALEKARKV